MEIGLSIMANPRHPLFWHIGALIAILLDSTRSMIMLPDNPIKRYPNSVYISMRAGCIHHDVRLGVHLVG